MKIYNKNWLEVPYRVQELFTKYSAAAAEAVQHPPDIDGGWIIDTSEVGPVFISKYALDLGGVFGAIPKALGSGIDGAQKLMGGPTPLTAGLVGGAMGAGLGYGGGWLAHKMMPKYFDEDAARKWSMLGGVAGAAGPAIVHGYPNVKELGWRGMLEPSRWQGREGNEEGIRQNLLPEKQDWTKEERKAFPSMAPEAARRLQEKRWLPEEEAELQRAHVYDATHPKEVTSSYIGDTLKAACELFGIEPVEDPFLEKAAEALAGAWLGEIPVDQWGRTIMYDPYLDDHSKAIASGLISAAGAAQGSRWVSPVDVARVAANTALGRGTGWGIGQIARTFLGVTPHAQQQLQQAGTLAGAVRGVLSMLA